MTEPLTPEQFRQLNRDLMEKVLDKAASDPAWKQRLLDEPEVALREAGFPEAERLQQMQDSVREQEPEVVGQLSRDFGCQSGHPGRVCINKMTDIMVPSFYMP